MTIKLHLAAFAAVSSVMLFFGQTAQAASNSYAWGQCTWYAKQRRPDLPNNLGNANNWYARAAAMGRKVGAAPRAGAVATTTAGRFGHVAVVDSVRGGTVNISEMNYAGGVGKVHHRAVAASSFRYIY